MPRRRRRTLEGIRIHRVRDLRDDEVTELHGIPVTTVPRTLLDIAEVSTAREVEQAYATALRRRMVTPDEMREMLNRHPEHRGAPMWRQILAQPEDPADLGEERLATIVRLARALHETR